MNTDNKKKEVASKMYKAEMEAHKRIGSSGFAHVRSAAENKKFHKSLQKGRESLNSVGKKMDNLVMEGKNEQEKN